MGGADREWEGGLERQQLDYHNPDEDGVMCVGWHSHPLKANCFQGNYLIMVFGAPHPML